MTYDDQTSVPGEIRLFFELRESELRHFQALNLQGQQLLVARIWEAVGECASHGTGGNWSSVDVPVGPNGAPDIDDAWILDQMGQAAVAVGLPVPRGVGIPCMRYDAGAGHPALPGDEDGGCEGEPDPPKPPHSCEACLKALDRPINVDGYLVDLVWEFRVQFGPLVQN